MRTLPAVLVAALALPLVPTALAGQPCTTPATKRDIGVCNTDTTDSRATCWAGPLV